MVTRCLIQILVFCSGERKCLGWFCLLLKVKQWWRCQELRRTRVLSNLRRVLFVISCLSRRRKVLNVVCQLWPRASVAASGTGIPRCSSNQGTASPADGIMDIYWYCAHLMLLDVITSCRCEEDIQSFGMTRYYCYSLTMISAKICWRELGSAEVLGVLAVLFCQRPWAGRACLQPCREWCRDPWTAVCEWGSALWEWRAL